MDASVNYYEIISVNRDADPETIETAIRSTRGTWRGRQGHPKQEVRAQAEAIMEHLRISEQVLLDPQKRSEYDRALDVRQEKPAPSQGGTEAEQLQAALDYLTKGKPALAHIKAKELTTVSPNSSAGWRVRGQAAVGVEDFQDAEYALSEACRIEPNEADNHEWLGDLYLSVGQPAEALKSYRTAHDLEPSAYRLTDIAEALVDNRQFPEGIRAIESAVADSGGDPLLKKEQLSLITKAVEGQISGWNYQGRRLRTVSSKSQLQLTKDAIAKMEEIYESLPEPDPDLKKDTIDVVKRIRSVARKPRFKFGNIKYYLAAGVASFILGLIISSQLGLFWFITFLGLPAIYIYRHLKPEWRWDERAVKKIEFSGGRTWEVDGVKNAIGDFTEGLGRGEKGVC